MGGYEEVFAISSCSDRSNMRIGDGMTRSVLRPHGRVSDESN